MKWSRNANAAKARKRLESPPPPREPKRIKAALPWQITLTNTIDGESATFTPRSARHAMRAIAVTIANYKPERKRTTLTTSAR